MSTNSKTPSAANLQPPPATADLQPPVTTKPQSPVTMNPQSPVTMNPQSPVTMNPQLPAPPDLQPPVAMNPQSPVAPDSQPPLAANPRATTDPLPENFAALIGIDWGDRKHATCLLPVGPDRLEHATLEQTPEALAEWVRKLRQRFGGRAVAVCLEQSRGALIHALMKYDFLVLFPIPPARLARYREAITSSGAKDDPSDAALALDYLRRHRERLRPWRPDDALTRQIALLSEARRRAVNLRTRLSNALKAQLKEYFPQAIGWLNDTVHTRLAADFLIKWPTLQTLQRAKPQTIRKFFYAHNYRRPDRLEDILVRIAAAQPLTNDVAIVEAATLTVRMLAGQLRPLAASLEQFDKKLAELFARHPDAAVFDSLPGAGAALAPRLLSAFGGDRERFESARQMQTYSGVAPVTIRSGRRCSVRRRWACPKFLRQTFHEFAGQSIIWSAWAKAYYQLQKAAGKPHHTAVRSLAFKWIRIIFRCWRDRIPYDESAYLQALRRRDSPLLQYLPEPAANDPPK